MPSYAILDAEFSHLRQIITHLREADAAEFQCLNLRPRRTLLGLWRRSAHRKVALVEGEIAAVWGDAAPLLSPTGEAWLVTASAIERAPLAFAREARAALREMLATRTTIVSGVAAGYERSIRFWTMAGFTLTRQTDDWHMLTLSR